MVLEFPYQDAPMFGTLPPLSNFSFNKSHGLSQAYVEPIVTFFNYSAKVPLMKIIVLWRGGCEKDPDSLHFLTKGCTKLGGIILDGYALTNESGFLCVSS